MKNHDSKKGRLVTIVLAARDHLAQLDEALAREIVSLVDAWASGAVVDVAGAERDMWRYASDALARRSFLTDDLLLRPEWTTESLADARIAVSAHALLCNAAAALCAAARLADEGARANHADDDAPHARLVARAAMDAVKCAALAASEESRRTPAKPANALSEAVVFTDYHAGPYRPYRGMFRTVDSDQPVRAADLIGALAVQVGACDGDEIVVTVHLSGRRPFGDRKVRCVVSGAYEREPESGKSKRTDADRR